MWFIPLLIATFLHLLVSNEVGLEKREAKHIVATVIITMSAALFIAMIFGLPYFIPDLNISIATSAEIQTVVWQYFVATIVGILIAEIILRSKDYIIAR